MREITAFNAPLVEIIEVTIGRESWFCQKKSLRLTVTFKDGSRREFTHIPGQIKPSVNETSGRIRML